MTFWVTIFLELPYLPDPNSFTSAVATTWAKFTSWVTQTHLTERYDELYQTGIDYDCLSFKALKNARDSLDRGDMVSAEKYLQKSYTYEMLSAMSFGAAAEVFDDNLEAGEILAKGIKDGCEASVKFGLAITNPEAAKAADYLYIGVDYAVDRALVGKEEAAKNAIVKTAVTTIFNEIKFKDLGDKTIADYTENKIGKVTFPMLQKAFKNNEQIQFALSKIIKESGVEIEEEAAEYILSYILDELEKTVNLKQSEVKSPVELRVYDSRGEATGLLNGEVGHGIPRSVYCDGTVTILFPLDTYRYEVIGTGTGTYKLGLTSIKDGEVINFTATDIPTSTNAIHQYTIDWDVLSQAEEGVTVKIDSDGDGIFEKTVTADNELSQEEYSTSTLPPLPPEPNQPPTLSDGYVTPASGDTSTIFNYYVTYKDPNGDAPIIKYVYIDGSSHTMTKIGGDYTSGARFKYSTKLSAGSHNYYFYFDDGHGHTVRLPTLGAYPGPTILTPTLPPSPSPSPKPTPSPSPSPKPNQPPTLSSGYVTPPSGDTSTIFNYYVTYKDPDGDAPAWHVVIKGAPPGLGGLSDHIMTKISGDYKSGAVFKYSTTLPALPAGYNYQYYFYFDDGHSHTVVYPDTEMFQGPTVVLPNQPPTLSNFSAGGQGQIGDFYITYTDPDGDTPTIKYVYIDGSPHTMTKISGDYISGAKFKYSTTLSVDEEHNFYYYFEDGNGHSVRWPASETIVIIPIPPPPPKP